MPARKVDQPSPPSPDDALLLELGESRLDRVDELLDELRPELRERFFFHLGLLVTGQEPDHAIVAALLRTATEARRARRASVVNEVER